MDNLHPRDDGIGTHDGPNGSAISLQSPAHDPAVGAEPLDVLPDSATTGVNRETHALRLLIYERDSLWRAVPETSRRSVSSRRLNANEWDINRELDRIDAEAVRRKRAEIADNDWL